MPKIVAVIPARKGSKRLPNKNKKMFAGKPLICWSIDTALECEFIDEVIVSTDDEDIILICNKNYRFFDRIRVIQRPSELAQDDTPMDKVVLSCMKEYPMDTTIILLQPTSPLRKLEALDLTIKIYKNFEPIPLPSQFKNPVVSCYRKNDYIFKLNGAIYITKKKNLHHERGFIEQFTFFYMMNKENSIDIDTLEEFKKAEKIMEKRLLKVDSI